MSRTLGASGQLHSPRPTPRPRRLDLRVLGMPLSAGDSSSWCHLPNSLLPLPGISPQGSSAVCRVCCICCGRFGSFTILSRALTTKSAPGPSLISPSSCSLAGRQHPSLWEAGPPKGPSLSLNPGSSDFNSNHRSCSLPTPPRDFESGSRDEEGCLNSLW